MHAPIHDFWGKTDRATGAWHPLIDHCADVAACGEAILATSVLRHRLETLAGAPLGPASLERLAVLIALHDIGKFNHGFQRKAEPAAQLTCGHVDEVIAPLCDGESETGRELWAELAEPLSWSEGDPALLAASICHHGHPVRMLWKAVDRKFWKASPTRDPMEGVRRLVDRCRAWFPLAWTDDDTRLPNGAAFNHAFAGLVTLADWIGSHRLFFPYSDEAAGDRMESARARARQAIGWIGLDPGGSPRIPLPSFQQISGHSTPRAAQRAVIDLPVTGERSLVILEAETGSGKTEAALAHFAALLHAGRVDGMYFAVPTRAAAVQLHRRIDEAAGRMFGEAKPPVTLAVPGYLRVDESEGRALPGFEVLWNDDPQYRFRHRGWSVENPKRYFAGALVVGTVDQVLLSALMTSHANVRATALLRSLLVIDEVHASDAYMTRLAEEALRYQLRAGGHALLMSATLGASARARYEALVDPSSLAPLARAIAEPYPRVAMGTTRVPVEDTGDPAKVVQWRTEEWADLPDALLQQLRAATAKGARVLVIRNTVKGALELQQRLEALGIPTLTHAGIPVPHHSRFAAADRRVLDQAVENALGKNAQRGAGLVCVATQTVEQSLDIDADLLITDLCPMDVLLQRIGRLHRHPSRSERPVGYRKATCIVLLPEALELREHIRPRGREPGVASGPHGIGTVYGDLRMLANTAQLVATRTAVTIPDDNRELVERATHPEALRWALEDERWQLHARHRDATRLSEGLLADLNALDRDQPYPFLQIPRDRKMVTRLGDDDRLVRFPAPVRSPLGPDIRGFTIPGFHAKTLSLPLEPVVTADASDPERLVIDVEAHRFTYDRLGLQWS